MRPLYTLLSLAATMTLSAQDLATPRMAILVPDRVISNSAHGRKLFSELEVLKKNLEEKLQAKGKEGQRLQSQLQSPSISPEGADKIKKELRDLDFDYKKLQEDSQTEYGALQQKVFSQFQQEIGPIVEGLAKEQKLQLVLQYQQGLVAYGEESWMLAFSNEVAKRYDAKFDAPAGAEKAHPAKAAPKK